MAAIVDSLLAASLLMGLMASPAAGGFQEAVDDFQENYSPLSQESEIPRSMDRHMDSERFETVTQTAFGEARFTSEGDRSLIQLENPDSRLEITKTPRFTLTEFVTDRGSVIKNSTVSGSRKVYETSEGELEVRKRQGARKTSFDGSNRQLMRQERKELESQLEKRLQDIQKLRERFRDQTDPRIQLEVDPETDRAEITNADTRTVNAKGWTLSKGEDYTLQIPQTELKPGETITAHVGEGENTDSDVYWGYSEDFSLWSEEEGTATLEGPEQEVIAKETW